MIYGGYFEPEKKESRIKELEQIMSEPNFWDNQKNSEKVISEVNTLRKKLENVSNLKHKIEDNIEMLNSINDEHELIELLIRTLY